jgi:hypothetical protein
VDNGSHRTGHLFGGKLRRQGRIKKGRKIFWRRQRSNAAVSDRRRQQMQTKTQCQPCRKEAKPPVRHFLCGHISPPLSHATKECVDGHSVARATGHVAYPWIGSGIGLLPGLLLFPHPDKRYLNDHLVGWAHRDTF